MRKKTAAPTQKHQRASSIQQPGLIAQGKTASQSATRRSALDNRSHRTNRVSAAADFGAGAAMFNVVRCWRAHKPNPFLLNVRGGQLQTPC